MKELYRRFGYLIAGLLVVLLAFALLHGSAPVKDGEITGDHQSPRPESGVNSTYPEAVSLTTTWSREYNSTFDAPVELGTDAVYVAPRGRVVYRLNDSTGADVWTRTFDGRVWGASMTYDGGELFVGVESEGMYCLDAGTGEELWSIPVHGEPKFEPLVTPDAVYVVTAFAGHLIEGPVLNESTIYKIRRSDGEVVWEVETTNYLLRTPEMDGERVYVGGSYMGEDAPEEGGLTRIYALDATSGDEAWRYESRDGLVKDMYLSGDTLAFLGYTDYIHGLDADTGEKVWEFYTGNWAPGFTGAGERIYVGTGHGFVYSLDVETGEKIWEYNINGTFNAPVGAPWIDGDRVVYNTLFGEVHVLDRETGEEKWISESTVKSRTVVKSRKDLIYYPGRNGELLAFEYDGE